MDDGQTPQSMVRDDAYRVIRVLSDGPSGRTELVSLAGEGPMVRKHIPAALANADAWVACMELDEPLLPRIESLYSMPDELVVVYDYVQGTSLDEQVAKEGPLDDVGAATMVGDVCQAVSVLHERGVVHRDITPGNIILSSDGAHLVDLGIARRRNEGRRHDTITLGTWGFAAPEQFGFAQTDARSDVFSLGNLLGFALTGVRPGSVEYEDALTDLEAERPEMLAVIRKATEFEPSARYQSAHAMGAAASEAAGIEYRWQASGEKQHGETGIQPEDAVTPSPRRIREAPLPAVVLAAIVWLLLVGYVLLDTYTTVSAIATHDPPWGPAQYAMSVITAACAYLVGREVYFSLTRRNAYAVNERPVPILLHRIAKFILITIILMFVAGALLPS